jgi:HTH-type transcriptional repressor of NAD biosynthesis genes
MTQSNSLFPTGLIVGRFHPPHLGHSWFIDRAAQQCDSLVVFVNTRAGETVPGTLRATWLADLHPQVTVVEVAHDLDTDWNDEDLWAKWIALFRRHWPHPTGPHAVFSSDSYVSELARRLGATAVVVDEERVNVPISATQIRNDPLAHLERLAPAVREWVEANHSLFR